MKHIRDTGHLLTEKVNERTLDIDLLDSREIVSLIVNEDVAVMEAVSAQIDNISRSVDVIVSVLRKGGRLFFVGAGTSGRLGVMEAAECPPTFGTDPELIRSIIAGGSEAVLNSIEGAEDSAESSRQEMERSGFSKRDVVVGIAASSSTPFVKGAIEHAKQIGAKSILVTCNEVDGLFPDVAITLLVGPEVIVGSTRLKSGTATKMVLNMLTTASMVRLGKTYKNLMVDVQPKSSKLRDRAVRIVSMISKVEKDKALELLQESNWNVKAAIVMFKKGLTAEESIKLLDAHNGFLRKIID